MKNNKKILLTTSAILMGSMFTTPVAQYFPQNAIFAADVVEFSRASLKKGQIVSVQGTVVSTVNAWGGQGFYLQTANNEGIYVYPKKDLAIKKGNVISFNATVGEYGGQLQLEKLTNYKVISATGNIAVQAKEISELTSPSLKDSYVEVRDVTVKNLKSSGQYNNTVFSVEDKNGQSVNVFIDNRTGYDFSAVSAKIKNGDIVSLKGFVSSRSNGTIELKPYTLDDVTTISKNNEETTAQEVANIGEIQGESHASPLQGKNVKVSNVVVTKVDKKGFYIQDINPDNNSKTSDAIYVTSKEKVNAGDKVSVEGLVQEGYGDGYADKTTTDLSTTQIVAQKVIKEGTASLPQPIDISAHMPKNIIDNDQFSKFDPEEDAIDYWEALEGMLVTVKQPRVLGPQLHGEIYVLPKGYSERTLNNAGGLNLNPNYHTTEIIPILVGDRKYRAKAKDYFTEDIQGVVTYTYGAYKVEALKMPQLHDGNLAREVSNLTPAEDKLTIASYNIENFSANSAAKETPEEKVEKIAKSFINEIHNPDIITLIEVQDNNGGVDDGTVDGTKSGERLANKIKELGGKEYKYTEVAPVNNVDGGKPGANIRVAFLYNPNRVQLVGENPGGSTEAATFVNGHLAKNPSRIEPTNAAFDSVRKSLAAEFKFKNENIVVIANHLKSKRGDDSVYGKKQPAVENSQPSRIEQAEIIGNFVQKGLAQNPNLKFVLTGDFNDYEFSKTIQALESHDLVSLLANHDEADRYSYFYRGNNQSLDNILVSKNIASNSKFDAVHVNSSFMEEDGRASDHDPLVVQIDFSNQSNPIKEPQNPGKENDGNDGQRGKENENNDGQTGKENENNGGQTGKENEKNDLKAPEQNRSETPQTVGEVEDSGKNESELTQKENSDQDAKKQESKFLAKTGLTSSSLTTIAGLGLLGVALLLARKYKKQK